MFGSYAHMIEPTTKTTEYWYKISVIAVAVATTTQIQAKINLDWIYLPFAPPQWNEGVHKHTHQHTYPVIKS